MAYISLQAKGGSLLLWPLRTARRQTLPFAQLRRSEVGILAEPAQQAARHAHGARPAPACRAIEADLGAISPGRAAAGGGHGAACGEGERAF